MRQRSKFMVEKYPLPTCPELLMSAQLVIDTRALEWTNRSGCSERWLEPGEKLILPAAPEPVMMAPFAINSAAAPRKNHPPHAPLRCSGATRLVDVNTTG